MRLFIAIEFNDQIKGSLYQVALKIKDNSVRCNITSKGNIHLTLRFLGDYTQIEAFKEAILNKVILPLGYNFLRPPSPLKGGNRKVSFNISPF